MTDRALVEVALKVDTTTWARQLAGFAKEVLPFAGSYAVNGTLFAARDALRDEAKKVFDRPVAFSVKSAFGYNMARLDGGELRGRIFIRDRQSAYYQYQIQGGPRVPGNIGPGEAWLFMPVAPELIDAKSGGLKKNVLRGLSRRAARKGQEPAKVHRTTKARDAKLRPVFFASVFETQAIWEPPERSRMIAPRRKGVRQVHNLASPRLLVAAYKEEQYRRPRFDFQGIVRRAREDLPVRFDQAIKMRLGKILADRGLTGL